MSKKILVLTPSFKNPGGVSSIFRVLKLDNEPNIRYFFISEENRAPRFLVSILKFLHFIFIFPSYDIIHLNPSLNKKAVMRDNLYALLPSLVKKQLIVYFHGWDTLFEEKLKQSKTYNWLFKKSLGKAETFILLGDIFKKKLQDFNLKGKKNYIIESTVADNNFFNKNIINSRLRLVDKKKSYKLLFMSRIVENKGTEIAIEAFQLLQDKHQGIALELHIAGDGSSLNEMKHLVKLKKINNIYFHGYLKGEEKHTLFEQCDIFFFPTYYMEGLPVVILEAMLYGMPIISRINAGIPDVIEDGINGFLTEDKKPQSFVPLIEKVIFDQNLYEKMISENHEKAQSRYTAEKVRRRILNVYNDLNKNY